MNAIANTKKEVANNIFAPRLLVYKDGTVERFTGIDFTPPSHDDPNSTVQSHDIVISENPLISARIFAPKAITGPHKKLPLIVYFHGGGFVTETPFTSRYHNFVTSLVATANAVAVSVHYRRAPEHPVPAAFDDSWVSLNWVASHFSGNGPHDLLNHHADFDNVFFAGDSAGANIAHKMAIRVGSEGLPGLNLEGIVLIHPYFWGARPLDEEEIEESVRLLVDGRWRFACPTTDGSDDPMMNPEMDPNLGRLGCKRIMVCVAGKDLYKERGRYYKEVVEKSGWVGMVGVMEALDERHVFHLFNPTSDNAVAMLNKIVSFINLK